MRLRPQALSLSLLKGRGDRRADAATNRELAEDGHPARSAGADQIVEDLVGDRLVEDAFVAKIDQVVFERFQLEAPAIGHVDDDDLAEIGKPRHRTDGGELGAPDFY